MAVRLSVIMIQSNPPTAGAQRMAEEVVGQLIGAEGIDLTLIGPLSSLSETSTDRLTLESLSGDVVALDWQGPEAILRGLAAVSFQAQRAPHPHDSEAPSPTPGQRRVFAFDMNRFRNPRELVDALRQLNARRQVRTFTIGMGSIGTDSGTETAANPQETSTPTAPPASNDADGPVAPASEPPGDGRTMRDGVPPRQPNSPAATTSEIDLDDLLDQLDQADP